MNRYLKAPALGLALAAVSVPAQADHFVTLYNNSSVAIKELYIGNYQSWDDLLKGAPNETGGGILPAGSSMNIHPVYHEAEMSCVASLIVTTEESTVLVTDIDTCANEIVLTDDDLLLDY